MSKIPQYLVILFITLSLAGYASGQTQKTTSNIEILKFKSESRGQIKKVSAIVAFPSDAKFPLPLIITQHGSSRDGLRFPGETDGQTDEYSTRIINAGTSRGFAVAAIDAFYDTKIKPQNKRAFPNAYQYAVDLRKILSDNPKINNKNIFYTGFSYGAGQVNKSLAANTSQTPISWRGVASVEPGCNIIHLPVKVDFPLLIIKGSESHYHMEPCEYFSKLVRDLGNSVKLKIIPGANHFFSTNGKIITGVAVNGCRFNPVIRTANRSFVFADGTPASRKQVIEKCFTREGGSGKNRVLLDGVVNDVLSFFESNVSK